MAIQISSRLARKWKAVTLANSIVHPAAPVTPSQRVTFIGDENMDESTEGHPYSWPETFIISGCVGSLVPTYHAFPGFYLTADFTTACADAAEDNADLIFISIGANDDNSGSIGGMQETVGNGLNALRNSNPNATIYVLNTLPRYSNAEGQQVIILNNIRTAISQACVEMGVTCWNTLDWIDATGTVDGYALNDTGALNVAEQVCLGLHPS